MHNTWYIICILQTFPNNVKPVKMKLMSLVHMSDLPSIFNSTLTGSGKILEMFSYIICCMQTVVYSTKKYKLGTTDLIIDCMDLATAITTYSMENKA